MLVRTLTRPSWFESREFSCGPTAVPIKITSRRITLPATNPETAAEWC